VDIPPPLFFAAAFFIGWLLDLYVFHLWPAMPPKTARGVALLGWTLVIAGMSLTYWGLSTFWRMRTPVYPNRDAKLLVVHGPYRFSRNPMYTGIIFACIGGCAIVKSLWPLVTLPFAIATLYLYVIRREERHLTEAFGEEYREYQRQVGRWLTF
jgi:protein-S-isoprenylcysteine O-methyltransferase Ste14